MFRRFKSFLSFALTALAVSASASIPAFQPLEATVPMVGRPSATEQFVYDALGNRIGFYNAEGKPITFGFDAQGRVTAITNAIGKVTSFAYDVNGNLTDRTDAKNEITHYDYNALNRLTNVVHEGQWKAAFGCDANGNLLNQQSAIANQQFSYDSMNRLRVSTQSVYSVSSVVQNSYDLNGNRTNIVYPGGLNVGYSYDAENRLVGVTTKYTNSTKTFAFGYDGASRLASISYPNGVNSAFGYDAESRVTNYVHGTFLNHTITRDPRGFKTREDISQGLVPTITNSLRQTRTHNDADQLTAVENLQSPIGNQQFSYDPNGGLTNSSGVTFGWSYDNRLISVSGGSNSTSTVYLYDASGARVGRIANGVTNYFVVDYAGALKRPLAETDASGNITRYYIWAGFQLLAHIEANGTVRYYHGDELGSTLALTDEAGTATDQFAYAPYGELLSRTGTNSTAFLWLGGYGVYYDATTDLHLTLHRAYSAAQKRFISPDPMGIDGGVNLYAYGNLNPLFFVDPYGLEGSDSSWWNPFSWDFGSFANDFVRGFTSPLAWTQEYLFDPIGLTVDQQMNLAVSTPWPDDAAVAAWGYLTTLGREATVINRAAKTTTALTKYEPWPKTPGSPHTDGFLFGARQAETAQPGQIFSRLGNTSGSYVAPPGTSLSARGLPAGYQGSESFWKVTKPFSMETGLSAPWQGSSGLGIQHKLPQSIDSLWESGYLSPVP